MLKFVFEKKIKIPSEQRRELNCSILVPRKHFSLGGGELGGHPIVFHKRGGIGWPLGCLPWEGKIRWLLDSFFFLKFSFFGGIEKNWVVAHFSYSKENGMALCIFFPRRIGWPIDYHFFFNFFFSST
jgi:hypothetical protein